YLIEGIERNDNGLTVRNGEDDEEDRERNEDQRRDDLAEHDRASSFLVMPENRGHVRLALWPCKKSLAGPIRPGRDACTSASYDGSPGRLRRSRISLPVLKNGTDFCSTET